MSSCVPLPPTSLLGKRKRKKQPDPNPLFSKWLAEWRDEAKEKGWKSEFIYSKALRSLHKYPLPLATGKECKILQHFGDKICKMLDDRLLKYKQEQENQASSGCSASDTDALSGSLSSCAAQPRPKFPAEVHEISDNSDDDEVVHQMTHASLPNGVHLGVPGTGSMAVKTAAGTASDSLKRTALMNIVSIDEQCNEEVLIMGQTSPVMVDNWDVSDDDLPALPMLPDLSVGRPCVTKLRHSPVKKSKEEDVRAVGPAAAAVTITEVQRFSDSDGDEAGQVAPPQQTGGGAGVRRPREYVPAHRSGPYAILLTLFRQAQDPDFRGFMTKEELSRAAQPLADKSFTVADPGSRYTAWSSVSILIKKGFLTKESSPAKYRLTDQGYELAHRLEEAERKPAAGDPCVRRGGAGGEGGRDGGMAAGMRRGHQSPLAEMGTDGDISAPPRPAKQVKRDSQNGREQEKKTSRGPLNNSGTCKDHPSYSNAAREGRIFIALTTDFEKEKKGTSAKDACLLLDDLDKGVVGDHELHTRTNADIGKEKKETSANDACFLLDDLDKGVVEDCKLHTRTSADIGKERKETSANHVCIALDDLEMEVPGDNKLLPTKSVDTEEEEEEKEASAKEAHLLVEDWDMSDDDADLPPLPLPSLAQRLKPASFTPASVSAAVSQNSGGDRKLQYWYVADGDRLVTRKGQACVSLDEELGVGFLVKISYQHLLQSGSQYTLDMTRPLGDDYVFAYLSDIDCYEEAWPPVTCPESGPIKSQSAMTDADPGSRPTHSISDSDSDSEPDPLPSRPAASSVPTTSHKIPTSSHTSCATKTKLQRQESIPKPEAKTRVGTSAGNSTTVPTVGPATSSQGSCSSAMPRVTSLPSSQSSTDSLRSASEDVAHFVLHPGSFEVVLCVDNREFYGSKSNSKSLLPDLIKNGVTCDLRLLNVGDLLWVAREKAVPGAPLGMMGNAQPARRELVLNYVVERKRMDDFVSSMIGGRLKEQKFRLKHSGLQEKIILIESYGSMDHFSISADRIRQAVANTEIIDGFTVKHTRDPRETAAYLTLLTRYLQSFYQNKTLRSCSQDSIKELGLKSDICDTEELLMPFDHFNQASLKNKPLTVKELFAKQLIQLWGMSAEKARAIVNKYPTPTSLFEAYAACMTDKERDSLLANLKYGKNLRNLGISLSRQVVQLYTSWVLT